MISVEAVIESVCFVFQKMCHSVLFYSVVFLSITSSLLMFHNDMVSFGNLNFGQSLDGTIIIRLSTFVIT